MAPDKFITLKVGLGIFVANYKTVPIYLLSVNFIIVINLKRKLSKLFHNAMSPLRNISRVSPSYTSRYSSKLIYMRSFRKGQNSLLVPQIKT